MLGFVVLLLEHIVLETDYNNNKIYKKVEKWQNYAQ